MASSHRVHFFHVIWSTKKRLNLILPSIKNRLYSYMASTVSKSGGYLLEIGGIENHVHLLLQINNLDNFTTIIRNTKASSSAWMKKEFPELHSFAWQDGYGSFSVSYSQLEKVKQYIQQQEEHHKTLSFEDEYLKLLNSCNTEYDKRFVFDE